MYYKCWINVTNINEYRAKANQREKQNISVNMASWVADRFICLQLRRHFVHHVNEILLLANENAEKSHMTSNAMLVCDGGL